MENFLKNIKNIPVPAINNLKKPVNSTPSANNGATTTIPTLLRPLSSTSSVVKTPAAQTYIQNQKQNTPTTPTINPSYDNTTGLLTDYGRSQGLPEVNKPTSTTTTPINSTQTSTEATTSNTTTPSATDTAFQAYIKSLMPSTDVTNAKTKYNDAVIARDTSLQGIQDQTIPMGFITGQQQSVANRSGIELNRLQGDIGLAQDTQKGLQDIGKAGFDYAQSKDKQNEPISVGGQLYQKQPDGTYKSVAGGAGAEGFTLGKDQVRYDAQGNVIATGAGAGTNNEAPVIKTFGQTDYSWNPDTKEWDPVTTSDTSPQAKIDKANKLLTDIETLKNTKGFQGAVGAKGLSSLFGLKGTPIAGSKSADYRARLDSIKGQLTLENMGVMKGVLSDSDIKIITSASSALSPDMSETEFKKELQKIEDVMKKVVEKSGQQENISSDEEAYLKSKGYSDAEIKSLKGFNSVGNTTASNIPQKNKNPGNVKQGGVADSLAIGMDNQGHLIFPDEETGFKAMQMDIEAKIKGNSKYLPANPTIAQLGKVYAEDPNWSNNVAKILGVTTLTPTNKIPISNLVKAIARQEGYYA